MIQVNVRDTAGNAFASTVFVSNDEAIPVVSRWIEEDFRVEAIPVVEDFLDENDQDHEGR